MEDVKESKPKNVSKKTTKSRGVLWCCWCLFLLAPILVVGLGWWIYSTPMPLEPISLNLPMLPKLTPPLVINSKLTEAKRMFEGMFEGPESIAFMRGNMFTGNHNGSLTYFSNSKAKLFGEFRKCTGETPCSRPLGFRYDQVRNRLLIADAYNGVYELIPSLGKAQLIFPFPGTSEPKVTLFNDLDVLADGRIVVSESSQKHQLHNTVNDFVESQPTGRILLVDPLKKSWRVLADGLYYPNGVQVHRDGKSVIVAEKMMSRLRRIALDENHSSTFGIILPGFPERIRASPRGGYWVAMSLARFVEEPSMMDRLSNWPQLRYFLFRILPTKYFDKLMKLPRHTIVVRIDDDGNVLESLHDTTDHVYDVTEAMEHNGYLYLGSSSANFVGELKL